MGGAMRAEILKLRRRPAFWILASLVLVTLVLFGYLFTWLFIVRGVGGEDVQVADADQFLRLLLPAEFVGATVSSLSGLGAALALILGALAVGSEYGWRTVKTIAVQRPSRLGLAAGKVAGIAVLVLAIALAALLLALLASLAVAAAEGESLALPGAGRVLAGIGAAWLLLMVWTAVGMLLAALFRGTGLAIGLGLVYVLLVEQILLALPLPERIADVLAAVMIGANGTALAEGLADASTTQGLGFDPVGAGQATLVLLAYLVGSLALAALLFRRRDIA